MAFHWRGQKGSASFDRRRHRHSTDVIRGKGTKNAASVDVIAGYRDKELFLAEDLSQYAPVHIATEDGSAGTKGTVIDAIEAERLKADVIFACGPMPMLRAIKKYAIENGSQAFISLEERMACGVGVCLGCVVKTRRPTITRMSRMRASVPMVPSMMRWTLKYSTLYVNWS